MNMDPIWIFLCVDEYMQHKWYHCAVLYSDVDSCPKQPISILSTLSLNEKLFNCQNPVLDIVQFQRLLQAEYLKLSECQYNIVVNLLAMEQEVWAPKPACIRLQLFPRKYLNLELILAGRGGMSNEQEVVGIPSLQEEREEKERKARVTAAWEKMNTGIPVKMPKILSNPSNSSGNKNKPAQKKTHDWMVTLGLAHKKSSINEVALGKRPASIGNGTSEEAKSVAAAALSAVRAAASAASAGRGKIEITEVRDFAGEEIEMKKLVDANSEAAEKAKAQGAHPSALDTILEQIQKKPKLSVLDKTKKDWGEFKENKGLEVELDAYKRSSNQYLDRVSFLHRTDMREFERERDARLALQSKRRTDMREDVL